MSETEIKSCASCPSFLGTREDISNFFGQNVDVALCARFGKVLGSNLYSDAKQEQKLHRQIANACAEYGAPRPPAPSAHDLQVAFPTVTSTRSDPSLVKNCNGCANLVRRDIVMEKFGFSASLCRAKGKLILDSRSVYEARNCQVSFLAPRDNRIDDVVLLPYYQGDFGTVDPISDFLRGRTTEVPDPQKYKTDRPVTDDEAEAGINAWRKIVDPSDDERYTFLPIYRTDSFSEADQQLIPKHTDPEFPHMYIDHFGGVYLSAVAWTELDETPALWGVAGTGKTELYRHLAWLMGLPFRRISITASTELDDLAGKMHYDPSKGTYFQYGRLPKAWSTPGVLCIDEPNVGPPEVWQFLRPLTDNSKQLVLDVNNGEAISRHNDCYMGMAMNPAWDARNVGANPIGDADANRLLHVNVPLPPENVERQIIKSRVQKDGWELSGSVMSSVMTTAADIRAMCEDGSLPTSWGIRPQIKVARLLRWFEPTIAYRRAVGDYLEPGICDRILEVVRANF